MAHHDAVTTGRPARPPVPSMRERFDLRAAAPRLPSLLLGLVMYGPGIALMVGSGLGLGPWDTLHQGVSRQTGIPMGTINIVLGLPILLLWWPIGERPGIGTVCNFVLVGTSTNVALAVLPVPPGDDLPLRVACFVAGVLIYAVATALYLSTDLGPGPRDGLMTGLVRRTGWPIRRARTLIELIVLAVGWALGGTVGIGTVVFALAIGPLVQAALGVVDREGRLGRARRARLEVEGAIGE